MYQITNYLEKTWQNSLSVGCSLCLEGFLILGETPTSAFKPEPQNAKEVSLSSSSMHTTLLQAKRNGELVQRGEGLEVFPTSPHYPSFLQLCSIVLRGTGHTHACLPPWVCTSYSLKLQFICLCKNEY